MPINKASKPLNTEATQRQTGGLIYKITARSEICKPTKGAAIVVRFSFQSSTIVRAIRCNCSMCARKDAAMLSHTLTPDALHISDNEGTLTEYQLGSFEAKHFFCTRCGIYTFHQTKRALGQYRVNLACIDALALPVEVFDDQHLL